MLSFYIQRIYTLIFREKDFCKGFLRTFCMTLRFVRRKSVENSDKIVSDSEEFSQTELREHNRRRVSIIRDQLHKQEI